MRARTIGVSLPNEMKHFRVKDGQRFYSPARSRYFDGWRGGSAALDLKRDNSNKQPARPMRGRAGWQTLVEFRRLNRPSGRARPVPRPSAPRW
jgi:hypothetical protein